MSVFELGRHSRFGVRSLLVIAFALLPILAESHYRGALSPEEAEQEYVGGQICGTCHIDQGRSHRESNFEGSWRAASALDSEMFPKRINEGGILYEIEKVDGRWIYHVSLPERQRQSFPVHSIVGGKRFGISFILEVSQIGAKGLSQPVLVEGRYMVEAGSGQLKLSPGFPQGVPKNYETAIGRVLSPEFAENCMDCHGGVADSQLARSGGPHPVYVDTGVSCERCHGPGGDHLQWLDSGMEGPPRITNPGRLNHTEALALCGQCHSGFFPVMQPRPQDLVISNQATAIANTDCYIQSASGFSCVSCHDGHGDAHRDNIRYETVCLQCHSQSSQTRICPENQADGCIGCHMPKHSAPGNFELTDHWIRVISE